MIAGGIEYGFVVHYIKRGCVMNLSLPSRLVTAMEAVKRKRLHFFTPEKAWLYTASSPEFFNAIVEDRLGVLYAQYGFNPPEHEDWVHPEIIYSVGYGLQSEEIAGSYHPLNSMFLKNPIAFVPTLEEMLEFAEHSRMIAMSISDKTGKALTAEEIHDRYVEMACLQLKYCESLLQSWREMGMPREQRDCLPLPCISQGKKLLVTQQHNVDSVKRNYENLRRNLFPQFILDRYFAVLLREEKIFDELKEMLKRMK